MNSTSMAPTGMPVGMMNDMGPMGYRNMNNMVSTSLPPVTSSSFHSMMPPMNNAGKMYMRPMPGPGRGW